MTPGQLRRMLGVKDRSTVWRWLTGERVPQPQMIQKIERLTKGAVTLDDFLDPSPPECARFVTMPDGTVRMLLPWSPGYDEDDHPGDPTESEARISAPLKRALQVLDGRGWFTPAGTFLLDGRASDPKRIVAEANQILLNRGEQPIPYPGVEPIHD